MATVKDKEDKSRVRPPVSSRKIETVAQEWQEATERPSENPLDNSEPRRRFLEAIASGEITGDVHDSFLEIRKP